MKRVTFLISVIVLILIPAPKKPLAIQSPSGQLYYAYPSDATPNKHEDPALCRPFVGQVSDGKLALRVSLPPFVPNVDVYLGVWSEALGADKIYMIMKGGQVMPYPDGFRPWRPNTSGNSDELAFGTTIPLAAIPQGTYHIYLAVTPTGAGNLNAYYIWSTYFSVVGPQGGTFKFPNGVTLDIPRGAFNEKTSVTAESLPCAEIDAILSAPNYGSHKKRCLDGLSIKAGLPPLKGPIVASIPVAEMNSADIPVQISVDLYKEEYQLARTDLVYRKTDGVLQMSIFPSEQIMANSSGKRTSETSGFEADYWNAVLLNQVDDACRDCFLSNLPEWKSICQFWAGYSGQQPCCLMNLGERLNCAYVRHCQCCREERNIIKVEEFDLSSLDCQVASAYVVVSFPDCPGAPVESNGVTELVGCPKGMKIQIDVHPSQVNLKTCEKRKVQARVTGRKPDGTLVFNDALFSATWKSLDPTVAMVNQDGTIEGISKGSTKIQALFGGNPEIAPGETIVQVSGLNSGGISISGNWSANFEVYEICDHELYTYEGEITIYEYENLIEIETPVGTVNGIRGCYSFSFEGGGFVEYGYEYGSGNGSISPNGRNIGGTFYWNFVGVDEVTGEPTVCPGYTTFSAAR